MVCCCVWSGRRGLRVNYIQVAKLLNASKFKGGRAGWRIFEHLAAAAAAEDKGKVENDVHR